MNKVLTFPGFIDVHVHFRDPGIPEAETTASGLETARRGGFAAVVTMPNTTPACDSPEAIAYQLSQTPSLPHSPTPSLPHSSPPPTPVSDGDWGLAQVLSILCRAEGIMAAPALLEDVVRMS